MLKLNNGTQENVIVVKIVMISLKKLLNSGDIKELCALGTLVSLAKDEKQITEIAQDYKDILEDYKLLQNGELHNSIKNIVQSATMNFTVFEVTHLGRMDEPEADVPS